MPRASPTMTNKRIPTRLSYILLLITCPSFLAAKQCECDDKDLYVFRSMGSEDLVLDGSDPEQVKVQYFNGSDAQLWKFQPAGKLGLSYIINQHHGKALDFRIGEDGAPRVALRDLQHTLQQQWNYDVDGHIVNAASLKNVDIVNANYVVGNHLIVWEDNGCRCQRFLLQKA